MACQLKMIILLKRIEEESARMKIRESVLSLKTIPQELLSEFGSVESLKRYIVCNDKFAKFVEDHSSTFVNDLVIGYQHKDIHCISYLNDGDFQSIIGLSLTHFGQLFASLIPGLSLLFPRCPAVLPPDGVSLNCSIRFVIQIYLHIMHITCENL
jgi:hypothetical protein